MEDRLQGVRILAPDRVVISKDAQIAEGVVVYPDNYILGKTVIGAGAVLYPENIIEDSIVDEGAQITKSVVRSSRVGANCTVGPYAHLRQGANLGRNCRVGDFVEIKNSSVGDGCKISHLAYVGDADLGEGCNVGCGVVFCNYDGKNKHRSRVGDCCFIGSNVNLVAPVTLGDGTFVAAGTTVTESANDGDFVIGRARQTNKAGGAEKYVSKQGGKQE